MKTFRAVGVLSPRRSEALTTNSQPSKRLVMCGIRISTRKLGSCGSSCHYQKLHLSLVVRQNCECHDSHPCNMLHSLFVCYSFQTRVLNFSDGQGVNRSSTWHWSWRTSRM